MLKLITLGLAFAPGLLIAKTDFSIRIKELTSFHSDAKVEIIREARLSMSVRSTGSSLRPDCFKEYNLNLPFAPQTVSYRISQNYNLGLDRQVIETQNLISSTKANQKNLEEKLHFGCGTEVVGLLLIKGELENGQAFKSSPNLYLKNGQLIIENGSAQTVLKSEKTTTVSTIPTVFFGQNWQRVWEQADPYNDTPQTNY